MKIDRSRAVEVLSDFRGELSAGWTVSNKDGLVNARVLERIAALDWAIAIMEAIERQKT
jgi:hypothetical protein